MEKTLTSAEAIWNRSLAAPLTVREAIEYLGCGQVRYVFETDEAWDKSKAASFSGRSNAGWHGAGANSKADHVAYQALAHAGPQRVAFVLADIEDTLRAAAWAAE